MVNLVGVGDNPHILYKNEDAETVARLAQEIHSGLGIVKLMTDPLLSELYNRVLLHSDQDVIDMLDGILIVTKDGPRKLMVGLVEVDMDEVFGAQQ